MKNPKTAVIVVSKFNLDLAVLVLKKIENCQIHGLNIIDAKVDVSFKNLAKHIQLLQKEKTNIIAICSIPIIIRSLEGKLPKKHNGSCIVALSPDGKYTIPLLDTHSGANKLATKLATILNSKPVITTQSDTFLGVSPDNPPPGFVLDPDCNYKEFISELLDKRSLKNVPAYSWLKSKKIRVSGSSKLEIKFSINSSIKPNKELLVYRPQKLIIGIGTVSGASYVKLKKLVLDTLEKKDLSIHSVKAIATIDLKRNERAINKLGQYLNKPIIHYKASELNKISAQLANSSEYVFRTVGSHSVAEAAALVAAGKSSKLIVEKNKSAEATCAVACSRQVIKNLPSTQNGTLSIIGLGPGSDAWRTIEVNNILDESTHYIGFSGYLDQIKKRRNKKYYRYPIGQEEERALKAISLARQGNKVALVCSGDPGIFAMGSIVYEILDNEDGESDIDIKMTPGISAFQAASAKVGAPFGNDFCIISLSNLLTPEKIILDRIHAALKGDFVLSIYNPTSSKRKYFFKIVLDHIQSVRSSDTPVVIAKNVGRKKEFIQCIKLREIKSDSIDMFTVLIIGSSQTKSFTKHKESTNVYTPRGYKLEKNRGIA